MKTFTAPFYSVLEFPPEKKRWCICILSDGKLRSAYYDPDGITDKIHCFWDSERFNASGVGKNGVTVVYWTYDEDMKEVHS